MLREVYIALTFLRTLKLELGDSLEKRVGLEESQVFVASSIIRA
jgi:hypothetical protein